MLPVFDRVRNPRECCYEGGAPWRQGPWLGAQALSQQWSRPLWELEVCSLHQDAAVAITADDRTLQILQASLSHYLRGSALARVTEAVYAM